VIVSYHFRLCSVDCLRKHDAWSAASCGQPGSSSGYGNSTSRTSSWFAIYIVASEICDTIRRPDIIYESMLPAWSTRSAPWAMGCCWQSKGAESDVLQPLYPLMAFFLPVLWMMLRKPDLTMPDPWRSICCTPVRMNCRPSGWKLVSQPVCWQLLFVFGAGSR